MALFYIALLCLFPCPNVPMFSSVVPIVVSLVVTVLICLILRSNDIESSSFLPTGHSLIQLRVRVLSTNAKKYNTFYCC